MPAELPFIDEWETTVAAPPERVFLCAADQVGRGFGGILPHLLSRILGCENSGDTYSVPPKVGQEASGFRVARVDQPNQLILEGQHRFAMYRLSFLIDPIAEGRSRLRARTDALFPGIQGTLYRALVIGSGGHEHVVKRLISSIAKNATRSVRVSL